jgi:hypothetical protein
MRQKCGQSWKVMIIPAALLAKCLNAECPYFVLLSSGLGCRVVTYVLNSVSAESATYIFRIEERTFCNHLQDHTF